MKTRILILIALQWLFMFFYNSASAAVWYQYTVNWTYTVIPTWFDAAWNVVTWAPVTFTIDTSAPAIETTFDFNRWYNSSTMTDITFDLRDQTGSTTADQQTWLASFSATVNWVSVNFTWFNTTTDISHVYPKISKAELLSKMTEKANNTLHIKTTDNAWNVTEFDYPIWIKYDNTVPALAFNDTNANWRNTTLTANVTTSDTVSWLAATRWNIWSDLNATCSDWSATAPFISATDWVFTVYACSMDNAWNIIRANQTYKIDRVNPIAWATYVNDSNANGWFNHDINITLNWSDDRSWVSYQRYQYDASCATSWTDFTTPTNIVDNLEWEHVLNVCIGDNAWNVNSYSYQLFMDKSAPSVATASIPDSKKAAMNNINLSMIVLDDANKAASANPYNTKTSYMVNSTISITWPQNFIQNYSIVTWNPLSQIVSLTKAWDYNISVSALDKAGNPFSFSKKLTIYPTDASLPNSTVALSTALWSKYANNTDVYTYDIVLKDQFNNLIYDKIITDIKQFKDNAEPSSKTLTTDMRNNSWNNAIFAQEFSTATNSAWTTTFKLRSLAPWEYSQYFHVTVPVWNDSYTNTSSSTIDLKALTLNSFKKPVTGKLVVADGTLSVWATEKVYLKWDNEWKVDAIPISMMNLDKVMPTDRNNFSITKTPVALSDLESSLDLKLNITWSLQPVWLEFPIWDDPYVSYTLAWQPIYYIVTDAANNYAVNTNVVFSSTNVKFSWVWVTWKTQWKGKQEVANSDIWSNFSEITASAQRNVIRANAYKLIKGMNSGNVVDWVKYVKWENVTISWDLSYELLVVKNWNVIINWNLNTSWKKLWIIVLNDTYKTDTDYNWTKWWNIYVNSNVVYIDAILYADGWLISSWVDWTPLVTDNDSRTQALEKQLVLKGSLFSRNTIWGSIEKNGYYFLPGQSPTQDYNKAMVYDLNYLRRNNNVTVDPSLPVWYNKDKNWNLKEWNFVVIYNSKILTDPPKWFASRENNR